MRLWRDESHSSTRSNDPATMIREFSAQQTNAVFIDVHSRMLGTDGQPLPDIYLKDRLHMNEKGYAIWQEVVGPFLK